MPSIELYSELCLLDVVVLFCVVVVLFVDVVVLFVVVVVLFVVVVVLSWLAFVPAALVAHHPQLTPFQLRRFPGTLLKSF